MSEKKFKLIGLGGAGINAVNYMIAKNAKDIDFVVIDSDSKSLSYSKAENKLCIETLKENKEDIRKRITDTDFICIVAGMGGNTGTELASVVTEICNKDNIPVAAIVTTPFDFEGEKVQQCCKQGLEDLEKCKCHVKVIPNQQIIGSVNPKLSTRDAFRKIDEMIAKGILTIKSAVNDSDFDIENLNKVLDTIVCDIEQKK